MHEQVLAINVRLHPEERAALDSWRRSFENPPSRASAARELIRLALSGREGERYAV